jgi:hypothetical protein
MTIYNCILYIKLIMSQSDYLKRKQTAQILRTDGGVGVNNHHPAIFSSHELLKYKQYQIINDDSNTKLNYNLITSVNKKIVFDMERDVTGCPTFIACTGTDDRPNRVLNTAGECQIQNHPLNWDQRKNMQNGKALCVCQLKRKHINRNVCSCDISTATIAAAAAAAA